MKNLTLIKFVNHIQIGHLYEHLFCMAVTRYLRSKGLFGYLDYELQATTFYTGQVKVDLSLYSKEAIDCIDAIGAIRSDINENTLNGALFQVLAEKYADIASIDETALLHTLERYDALPWQSIQSFGIKDISSVKKTHRGLQLSDRNRRHFIILQQKIQLDAAFARTNKTTYWPLFMIIGRLFEDTLREDIADASRCFSYDNTTVYSNTRVQATNFYRIDRRHSAKLQSEVRVTEQLIGQMLRRNCIEKIVAYLQSLDFTQQGTPPDEEGLYIQTGLVVGAEGWRGIGTVNNIAEVLRHITIEFSIGRESQQLSVGDILKTSHH